MESMKETPKISINSVPINKIHTNYQGKDGPIQSLAIINYNVDNDSLNDNCFEDDSTCQVRTFPEVLNGNASFWMKVGTEIRFIDDSARSSVSSYNQTMCQNTANHTLTPENVPEISLPGVQDHQVSPDHLEIYNLKSTNKHYSSLTTLSLSEQQSSISSIEDTGNWESRHSVPSAQKTTENQLSRIPLKSCLVEIDETGSKVSCSCIVEPRHLSFLQNEYDCEQVPVQEMNAVNEVSLHRKHHLHHCSGNSGQGSTAAAPIDALDSQSLCSIYMEKDCRYYFQHPWSRLFIAYFVIFCNFLIFAEDPVSHSHTESSIPVVGNVFAFVMTKYPPEWEWRMVKILLWIAAIITGMGFGKHVIHKWLLARLCRLKMFHEEQGSWMIMFLTVIVSLYIFSNIYNTFLEVGHPFACKYQITALMGITNSSVMKAAACGTWLGDFITAWMVTDMMLQDSVYPKWVPGLRQFWRQGNTRIVTFWAGSLGMSAMVITLIVSDWINWDKLNRDFVATTELSRAFLASFILVMDLFIVMQASKWFNYGIIFLVMILDLNMWKNQFFYIPGDYGQYIGHDYKIYTVSEQDVLATENCTLWTYEWRSTNNDPETNKSLLENDMLMNSRYLIYSLEEKCTAFIPSVIGFSIFGLLVYLYGRFPPKTSENLGGRLKLRKRSYQSSWKRERGSFNKEESCPLPSNNQVPQQTRFKNGLHAANNNNDTTNT